MSYPTVAADILEDAHAAGRTWGSDYEKIWDTMEAMAPQLGPYCHALANTILPQARWVKSIWYWAAWAALIAGFVFLNLATNARKHYQHPDVYDMFTGISFVASVALWGVCAFLTYEANRDLEDRRRIVKEAIADGALAAIQERRDKARAYDPAKKKRKKGKGFTPGGPAPLPQPFGVSHEGAEQLVAQWMTYLGAQGVATTTFTGDGGVDVTSHHYIAQVKNYTGSVDVEAVRALGGVAYADGRKPLFFTSGTYTAGSVAFASQVGMGLFRYDAIQGTLEPVGDLATRYMTTGL